MVSKQVSKLPKSQAEAKKMAISYNAERGTYYLPNGLVVKWVGAAAKIVGRWDP